MNNASALEVQGHEPNNPAFVNASARFSSYVFAFDRLDDDAASALLNLADDQFTSIKSKSWLLRRMRAKAKHNAKAAKEYPKALARDHARQAADRAARARAARRLPRIVQPVAHTAPRAKGSRPVRAPRQQSEGASGSGGSGSGEGSGDGPGDGGDPPDPIAPIVAGFRATVARASRVANACVPSSRTGEHASDCHVSADARNVFVQPGDAMFIRQYEGWKPSRAFDAIAGPAKSSFLAELRRRGVAEKTRPDVQDALWTYDHLRTSARQHADRMPAHWETWSGSLGGNGDR